MKLLKSPVVIALGLFSLSGCNLLKTQSNSSLALPLNFNAPTIDEKHCIRDLEAHEEFQVTEIGNLWPRMRAGYQLPDTEHDRIETYVKWYARHPHYIDRVVERGQRYLHYIVSELEANDMPLELALLPVIESAFDPFAYSHGRASGIWQFVPATGRDYGLNQTWWYDGRRDLVASTDAAIRYLKRLHALFDEDWLLALAAYNTGEGNLGRAIRRNRQQGLPTDFWSLRLPRETRNYVPQLIALSKVIGDPEAYNITLQPVPDQPFFAQVNVGSQIDFAKAAEMAGMDIEELYLLNAGYNRWATDPDGPHRLLIPIQYADQLNAQLAEMSEEERVSWTRYKVKSGDSLITIARRHHTSVGTIQTVNGLNGHIIRAGQTLMIPTATQSDEHYAYSAGQRLQRQQSRSRGQDGSRKVEYEVRPGDSFWKIARGHGVTVNSLTSWNGMAPGDKLMPGQKLVIWTKRQDVASAQTPAFNNRATVRKVNYRVRQGDSIARIANRFNVNISDILSWNEVAENSYIHPGQSLTLFVDVTGN